jgi:hypothetical protein
MHTCNDYAVSLCRIGRKLQNKGISGLTNKNFLDVVSQYHVRTAGSWWTPRQVFKALVKGGAFKRISRGVYVYQKDLTEHQVRNEVRKYAKR